MPDHKGTQCKMRDDLQTNGIRIQSDPDPKSVEFPSNFGSVEFSIPSKDRP